MERYPTNIAQNAQIYGCVTVITSQSHESQPTRFRSIGRGTIRHVERTALECLFTIQRMLGYNMDVQGIKYSLLFAQHSIREKFEPELVAILSFLLYKFSIYDSSASYGSQLQNLKYRNESLHKGACKYIWEQHWNNSAIVPCKIMFLNLSRLPSGILCQRCTSN